jgi:VWFA-related protein
VVLHTTVVDKSGKLVTNLKQDAFSVSENDVKQEILLFRREDIPVSMGLIIDNSGSMRPKRASVEAAALALVKDSNPALAADSQGTRGEESLRPSGRADPRS